jgi:chemotaxis protein methyltransferase CheR
MLTTTDIKEIIQIIKQCCGYNLEDYAEGSLIRRVDRILLNEKVNFTTLLSRLQTNKDFCKHIVEEITVNTTELFRDPKIWTFLRTNTMLDLQKRPHINIWIAGSSTGQEAYSMAILLSELGLLDKSRIFASDINTKVLDIARKGVYRYRINLDSISNFEKVIMHNPLDFDDKQTIQMEKYFSVDYAKDQILMHDFLRKKIIFLENDLVKNPKLDFANFDLISCRNVLIYLNNQLQTKILKGFHSNLHPNSYLLLGIHESILGSASVHFKKKGYVYYDEL